MTRSLSLHHLSALELGPAALVHTAADAGFDHVCVFTQRPDYAAFSAPIIDPSNVAEVRSAMRDRDLSAYNIESFFLGPDTRVEDFRAALDIGASIGGTRATAIVMEPDEARAQDLFAAFAALAAEFGIGAGVEFLRFSPVSNLEKACRLVQAAGHANGSVTIDMLHLMRNGGCAADVAAMDSGLIGYVQLCDGPLAAPADPRDEAVANRQIPGAGEFPLREILAAIPADRTIGVEVPLNALRDRGVDALERARRLHAAVRRLEA